VVVGRGHAVVCPYPGGPQSLNRESQAGTAYRLECGWVGGGSSWRTRRGEARQRKKISRAEARRTRREWKVKNEKWKVEEEASHGIRGRTRKGNASAVAGKLWRDLRDYADGDDLGQRDMSRCSDSGL